MSLRIWSPSAAGAEIVTALGEGAALVGRDDRPQLVIQDAEQERVSAPGARTVTIAPTRVVEIEMTIVELAAAIGVSARAPEVIDSIQKPIEAVLAAVVNEPRRAVFVAARTSPLVAADRWVPEMVTIAGGRPVTGPASWDEVRAATPDLVVITDGDEGGVPPGLGCRVVSVDGGYYTLPGPRIAYGIVQLGFLLHPDRLVEPKLPLQEVAR